VAAVVLTAEMAMIPVALAAGRLCDRWGRKWVFGVGFVVLPVRIFLHSLTSDPRVLVALQAPDGVGAGIYGVVIVAICADLTRGRGGFNTLLGLIATALSVGGVVGPRLAGCWSSAWVSRWPSTPSPASRRLGRPCSWVSCPRRGPPQPPAPTRASRTTSPMSTA
jgi:MFS family permease